jgi:molybdopterin molybdotransferase
MLHVLAKLCSLITTQATEAVSIADGHGRVLSKDVLSNKFVPYQDICSVSGYAITSSSINQTPMYLKKVGSSKPKNLFTQRLHEAQAVEVSAGIPVPLGADCVIAKDQIKEDDGVTILIDEFVTAGKNIASKGIDIAKDDIVLKKGTLLNSNHIALAAILGIPWLEVTRSPRIGVIDCSIDNVVSDSSGELDQCIDSAIGHFISANNAMPLFLGNSAQLNDSLEEIIFFKNNLELAMQSVDLLLVIGGVNNLAENIVFTTLMQKGASLENVKILVGSQYQIVIGSYQKKPVLGIPSHYVAFLLFARLALMPLIKTMLGVKRNAKTYAKLSRDLDEYDKQNHFLLGILEQTNTGQLMVTAVSASDELMLSVLSKTHCLIVIDLSSDLKSGNIVEIIMLDGFSINLQN